MTTRSLSPVHAQASSQILRGAAASCAVKTAAAWDGLALGGLFAGLDLGSYRLDTRFGRSGLESEGRNGRWSGTGAT